MPGAELILWSRLKGKGLNGFKFRRQYGIGRYVADFYCAQVKLVIEIDGDSHFNPEAEEYDRLREKFIESAGIRVLRFTNNDIRGNLNGVLEVIEQSIMASSSEQNVILPPRKNTPPPSAPPLQKGRKN